MRTDILKIKTLFVTLFISVLALFSCKKYLDVKPVRSLLVPTSLTDLQALLDNHRIMNERSVQLLELVADNYYITTASWNAASSQNENLNYVWDANATNLNSWNAPYQNGIYYSNLILDQLSSIQVSGGDQDSYNSIKGSALFFRSFAFHQTAQLYCRPYSSTADTDPGIVLRLTSDINSKSKRSTVAETYGQITEDLKNAAILLPKVSAFPTRPNRAAAYGALARAYLAMRDYTNAGKYADSCLKYYNKLIDYSSIPIASTIPFVRFNNETIFYSHSAVPGILFPPIPLINDDLYRSYSSDDLRKTLFFKANGDGTFSFKGGYDGNFGVYAPFDGIATDEVMLIRSESYARNGDVTSAMKDLNDLLKTRWAKNPDGSTKYINQTASSKNDALDKIATERRKELLFRGLRWSDLRRYNLDGANITLTRNVNNTIYTLPPNDLRWVVLIPLGIISISGIQQNPR